MLFQRIAAWTVLALMLALLAFGLATRGADAFTSWEAAGAVRFLIFLAMYAALAGAAVALRPALLPWIVGAGGAVYAVIVVGPIAPFALIFLVLAFHATGSFWMRNRPHAIEEMPHALIILGAATWITLMALTARWRVHYWYVYAAVLALPLIWAATRKVLLPRFSVAGVTRSDAVNHALVLLPVAANFLVALQPEVGRDALAVHMVVPMRVAAEHLWAFDFREFAWALKPMGTEWSFTLAWLLGGEAGARLVNWLFFAVTAWLLFDWLKALVTPRQAALLAACFASAPLALRVSGSLGAFTLLGALLLAAAAFLRRYYRSRRSAYFLTFAALCGAMLGVTPSAVPYVFPLFIACCITVPFGLLARASTLTAAVACIPYLESSVRSASPLFPYLNAYFRSQYFDTTTNFLGDRITRPVEFGAWLDPSVGFFFILLVPFCFTAIRANWPKIAWVLLAACVVGPLATYFVDASLPRLYPALPLFTILIATALAVFKDHDRLLTTALTAVAAIAFIGHLAVLPAAAPSHAGFVSSPAEGSAGRLDYVTRHAPERRLIDELNRREPNVLAVWFDSNAVAGFHGHSYSTTWHSNPYFRRFAESTSSQALFLLSTELRQKYFIAPASGSAWPVTTVFWREFIDLYTTRVAEAGGMELRVMEPRLGGLAQPPAFYAPPGRYDDINSYIRYEGPWTRDFTFPQAYGGSVVYSNDMRAAAMIRFEGSAVTILHTAAGNRCQGSMSLDRNPPVPLNQNSAQTRYQARASRITTEPGRHQLLIRLPQSAGTRSAIAGCYLEIDGFIVE